jgi:hypothetical protein
MNSKNLENKHTCEFCNKSFSREKTLVVHVCEKKRRALAKDEVAVKTSFYAYSRFLELNKKEKQTYDQFCQSNFYNAFVKFGTYIHAIKAIDPEQFIDYVLKSGIKLDNWAKDSTYKKYVIELIKKEPVEKAIERNIALLNKWAEDNDESWRNFFKVITPALATNLIIVGRISPWLLYNCDTAHFLFDRMTPEQMKLIDEYIDPKFWNIKFKTNLTDVNFIRSVLTEAGI